MVLIGVILTDPERGVQTLASWGPGLPAGATVNCGDSCCGREGGGPVTVGVADTLRYRCFGVFFGLHGAWKILAGHGRGGVLHTVSGTGQDLGDRCLQRAWASVLMSYKRKRRKST